MASDGSIFIEGWEKTLQQSGSSFEPCSAADSATCWWLDSTWRVAFRKNLSTGASVKVFVSPSGVIKTSKRDHEAFIAKQVAANSNKDIPDTSDTKASIAKQVAAILQQSGKQAPKASAAEREALRFLAAEEASTSASQQPANGDSDDYHPYKIWIYDDFQEEIAALKKIAAAEFQRPSNWPDSCVPDTGKWTLWVPEGWGQAVKTAASGTTVIVWLDPQGKIYYNKSKVAEVATLRNEADAGSVAGDKPKEWPDRLPIDWAMSRKDGSSGNSKDGTIKIFIKPSMDGAFLNLVDVEKYIAGVTGTKGAKIRVDPSLHPAAKRVGDPPSSPVAKRTKLDTTLSISEEMEQVKNLSCSANAKKMREDCYELQKLQDGRWAVLPVDLSSVCLPMFREHMGKQGWSCIIAGDDYDTYSKSKVASEVKLFANSGRMLVCDTSRAVAVRVAELYRDLLYSKDCL